MRVLHISSSDSVGGAARSAINLHESLLLENIDSIFFAAERTGVKSDRKLHFKYGYFVRRILATIDALPLKKYPGRNIDYPFSTNWFRSGIIKRIRKVKPDIVHIHWIGKGVLRIEDFKRIKVPIFWTMHDNFPFTGGCHLVFDCKKFESKCGECPQLASL